MPPILWIGLAVLGGAFLLRGSGASGRSPGTPGPQGTPKPDASAGNADQAGNPKADGMGLPGITGGLAKGSAADWLQNGFAPFNVSSGGDQAGGSAAPSSSRGR